MANRKPRLAPGIRTRIVQLRASNSDHTISLDTILSMLSKEGWDRLPSRGSVQNVVHWWEGLDPEIRVRELPFQWQLLERARIPWEASDWVLSCWHVFDGLKQLSVMDGAKTLLKAWEPFTNRWATWSWRVHLAASDLPEMVVIAIAAEYSLAEAFTDFGFAPEVGLQGIDAFLRRRPWASKGRAKCYEEAVRDGLLPPIPRYNYEVAVELGHSAAEPLTSEFGPAFTGILSGYWRLWYRCEIIPIRQRTRLVRRHKTPLDNWLELVQGVLKLQEENRN